MMNPALTQALAEVGWTKLGIALAAGLFLNVFVLWGASLLFSQSEGTFRNALRCVGLSFFFNLAAGFVYLLGAVVLAFSLLLDNGTVVNSLILIWMAAYILGLISIPMSVYQLDFVRALFLLVIAAVIAGGVEFGCGQVLGRFAGINWLDSRDEISRLVTQLRTQAPSVNAASEQSPPVEGAPASARAQSPNPSPHSSPLLPGEVALTAPATIPAVINGQSVGTVTLPRGTRVRLLSSQNGMLRIKYQETVADIPESTVGRP